MSAVDLPEIDPKTGFYPTMNAMGGMTPTLDEFAAAFAKFAGGAPGPVLDVGAAYGIATIAALEAGGSVIANDMEPRHLEVLRERVPAAYHAKLQTVVGAFPGGLSFAPGALGGCLLARMLHFLDGASIDQGFAQLHSWIAPGGKVFGVAVTPYLAKLVPYRPTYMARVAAGERWPGENVDVAAHDPEAAAGLPARMHFLDVDVVTRALTDADFVVERAERLARQAFVNDMALDGRELVGFIARRP